MSSQAKVDAVLALPGIDRIIEQIRNTPPSERNITHIRERVVRHARLDEDFDTSIITGNVVRQLI